MRVRLEVEGRRHRLGRGAHRPHGALRRLEKLCRDMGRKVEERRQRRLPAAEPGVPLHHLRGRRLPDRHADHREPVAADRPLHEPAAGARPHPRHQRPPPGRLHRPGPARRRSPPARLSAPTCTPAPPSCAPTSPPPSRARPRSRPCLRAAALLLVLVEHLVQRLQEQVGVLTAEHQRRPHLQAVGVRPGGADQDCGGAGR